MNKSVTQKLVSNEGCKLAATAYRQVASVPWVVFSNSLMTDQTIWDAQVCHLAERYNILTYDQRGHGLSEVGRVTFDLLSSDVVALLDYFGIGECTYVGLSMGVPTGLGLVSRHPERVTGMVLSDGQIATQPSGRQTWQGRIDAARANGMPWVAKDTVARWFHPGFVAAGGAEKLQAAAAAMSVDGYCNCASALQDYDFMEVATALSVPVQLIAGSNDGAMPQTMRTMADTIPRSRLDIIPDAGHIPNVEQPDRFNSLLERFLDNQKT